jgi:predicted nucleotidyltransferase
MSIKNALFTDSQSKVYAWIFGHPDRSYHLSELAKLTGLASASLQREINRLTQAGLVLSDMVGNQRRISANRHSPVFEELYQLTRKAMGAEPLLREALRPLSDKMACALIYGSVAKGTDTATSDIDILIVSDNVGLSDVLEHCRDAEIQLGRKINPNCYTLPEFNQRLQEQDSFVQRVLAQPTIDLFGGKHAVSGTQKLRKNRPVKT